MDRRNPRRPHWRTLEMARALGIDIAAALHDRRIGRDAYGDMVDACARCTWAEGCAVWVRTGEAGTGAPEVCANRAAFAALGD